eukprot:2236919-Prymnesium_polylepis.1
MDEASQVQRQPQDEAGVGGEARLASSRLASARGEAGLGMTGRRARPGYHYQLIRPKTRFVRRAQRD